MSSPKIHTPERLSSDSGSDSDGPTKDKIWIDKASELFKVNRKRKLLARKYKQLSKDLQNLSNDQTTKRGRYEYRLISRLGPVNYSQIPELKDVDLEAHRKPNVSTWKLEVVE